MIHTSKREIKALVDRRLALTLDEFNAQYPGERGYLSQIAYACNDSGCSAQLYTHYSKHVLVAVFGSEIYSV